MLVAGLLAGWILTGFGFSQQVAPSVQTLVVMHFENRSSAPGLEWISESFPEILGQRIASEDFYVLGREYRLHAYDRAGIPAGIHPSRATLYRVAEQMDVDYAVLGSYSFDGQAFSASAQLLDMKQRRLSPELKESGPLPQLLQVQAALAWDLLRALRPDYATAKDAFMAAASPLRLDAFENYIRGLTALTEADKLQRLRTAIRLNPSYSEAMLELGKTYFEAHDYDAAANWLARIPATNPLAREANFFLGLAAYYQGNFPRSEAAFRSLLEQFPLTEVYNNLGVVSARLGKAEARQWFQKAVDADPSDPDYRFNLGLALLRDGEREGAGRQLRECLALRSDDNEAKSLLATIGGQAASLAEVKPTAAAGAAPAAAKLPQERIKRNYDEAAFRELAVDTQNASESRLTKLDARSHAAYHLQHGHDLLSKGFPAEAEKELREAVELDGSNALAHAELADTLNLNHDAAGARAESDAALRLTPSAAVYVVLARINLRDNNRDGAAQLVSRALQLDPNNAEALAVKQKMESKADTVPQSPSPKQ
ncbi:MAG TPA: tetratricopeptide repeat protein [Terriglobales bacterium]|nr:tetratricopeptide repeat protein [Terriglobales bacterium]